VTAWARDNVPTIIGWVMAVITAVAIGAAHVAAIDYRLDVVEKDAVRTESTVERLDRSVAKLEALVERIEAAR
jgi:hypothetical protein